MKSPIYGPYLGEIKKRPTETNSMRRFARSDQLDEAGFTESKRGEP